MKVLYTAPNRGHHFTYAEGLNKANMLFRFVTGVSRFNKYANGSSFNEKLNRVDIVQSFYLLALKFKLPEFITNYLAYIAKVEQDNACRSLIKMNNVDFFIFYSGSGLNTCKHLIKQSSKCLKIVEAVNSHLSVQEELLCEEYQSLQLKWQPFSKQEKKRRLNEYQLADYILLPSEFVRNSFIKSGFPAEKLLKVPYGFNKKISDTKDYSNSATFSILYVGSISVRKGIKYLLEAFNLLKHPNKELVIVGPQTSESGLDGFILPNTVIFTGVLKGDDLSKRYASASVFCLPSIEEGLALVLGEAMSFGLPIIATENSGAQDIIENGVEGFIVPIRDSYSISEKLQVLANDKTLYKKIQNAAIYKASRLDGWTETTVKLTGLLHDIYKRKVIND